MGRIFQATNNIYCVQVDSKFTVSNYSLTEDSKVKDPKTQL